MCVPVKKVKQVSSSDLLALQVLTLLALLLLNLLALLEELLRFVACGDVEILPASLQAVFVLLYQ
jgi:hypothetical protein